MVNINHENRELKVKYNKLIEEEKAVTKSICDLHMKKLGCEAKVKNNEVLVKKYGYDLEEEIENFKRMIKEIVPTLCELYLRKCEISKELKDVEYLIKINALMSKEV